jgi:Domain of unknown function (DUF4129)
MKRWWPVAGVFAMLALAGMAAATVQLPLSQVDDRAAVEDAAATVAPTFQPQPSFVSQAPKEFHSVTLPGWVLWALLAAGVLVVAIAVVVGLGAAVRKGSRFKRRAIRRTPPQPVSQAEVESEVVAALDAGLSELDESERDPRRAVIACWVRLERAAGAAGTPRQRGDSPTDLVLRLLTGHHLSEGVLTGFAEVYRQARYSARHHVDEGMREQARYALRQLRGELTGVATPA